MDKFLQTIKRFIPKRIFTALAPIYHYKLAVIGALLYRFPSGKIKVVGVTGTKGKTTTVELINAILEEAGRKDEVDAIEALKSLGYSQSEAREALKGVADSVKGTSARVKAALKNLGKQTE